MKKFFREFKEFALKGNIIDLAVAVVIGGIFNSVIKSLVDNIIIPFAEVLVGGQKIGQLYFAVGKAHIKYGAFIQSIVNFLIVSLTIFVVIKFFNLALAKLKIKESEELKKAESKKVPEVDKKELLLQEIRDLLKENQKNK